MQMWPGRYDLVIESWRTNEGRFDASPDRVNEWTITLPDELIRDVRAKLRCQEPKSVRISVCCGIELPRA